MTRLEQHRQDVVALGVILAPLVDEIEDQVVGLGPQALETLPVLAALEEGDHRGGAAADRKQFVEPLAQPVQVRTRAEAEHRAQDHFERQRLEAGVEHHRPVRRPRCRLLLGDLLHGAGEALHLLAVEGRQHHLALCEVVALVQQDHGVAPDDGLEDPRPLARMQDFGGGREDLLDLVGVGDHHERRRRQQAHREAVAVLRPAAFQERNGARPPCDRLDRAGLARAGWKRCVCRHFSSSSPGNYPGPAPDSVRMVTQI